MKDKVKEQLPEWFDGQIYELGDEVRNPYSGETVLLNAAELSMYDLIKGAEMVLHMGVAADHCVDVINKGKDWFLSENPKAYMALLD
mgnify:FL=1